MAYPRDEIKTEKFATFLSSEIKRSKYHSQRAFANAAGVSTASVSRMLRNLQFPDIETLKKIAPAIGRTNNELLKIAGYLEDTANPKDAA